MPTYRNRDSGAVVVTDGTDDPYADDPVYGLIDDEHTEATPAPVAPPEPEPEPEPEPPAAA